MRLTEFLGAFFPDPAEPLWLFGFSPKELPDPKKRAPKKICVTRGEIASDRRLQGELREWNREMGLYFTVNSGGTKKEEIDRINAVFCEIDDRPIEEQHDIYDNAWYPPSLRIVTRKSVHAYWLLEDPLTVAEFEEVQAGLIRTFGADKALKNPNRVMRMPHFNHVSWADGEFRHTPVAWHTFRPDRRFTLAELREAYVPPPEPVAVPRFERKVENAWDELFVEMGNRFRQLPGYHVEPGGKLASARGICHNGETDRSLVMNLETGKIFCRSDCDFDTVLQALGLVRPEKREKRFAIPRVTRPKPNTELYNWLVEVNG